MPPADPKEGSGDAEYLKATNFGNILLPVLPLIKTYLLKTQLFNVVGNMGYMSVD